MNSTPTASPPSPPLALEHVLCTEELARRPTRPPDYKTENRALVSLMRSLADSPGGILQVLADTILDALGADSAGISLVTEDSQRFYWPAIAGAWKPHIGGGTPRDFGPCGDVLDRNSPLLFARLERRYAYFAPVTPSVEEALLIPFYVAGKAVGTLWAVAHDDHRRFDGEDLRLLESLGAFASAAYQSVQQLHALQMQDQRSQEAARTLREINEQLVLSSIHQHEISEQLAEVSRHKDEFLATLAHELRNPLAPIRNAVAFLDMEDLPEPDAKSARDVIDRQVTVMVRLIDDLLDVSRISRNKLDVRKQRVDLASIVESAVESSRPLIAERGHELAVSLPPEPVLLDADPVRLAQVFLNLLNNAAKYTKRGGRIWLTVEREASEAVIRVRDDGIGIPDDMLANIFGMFTQVERSLEKSQGGLGIGLTLVRRLLDMHDGSIEAHSPGIDRGSEFVVRLPLPNDPAREPLLSVDRPRPRKLSDLRILIVDDNRDSADTLGMLLRLMGNEIELAYDGLQAVEAANTFRPELVLLDIGLPKLNGYDVARRIRQQPWGQDVTLVALTGWGQDDDRRRSQEAGFNFHLVKPVDLAALELMLAKP